MRLPTFFRPTVGQRELPWGRSKQIPGGEDREITPEYKLLHCFLIEKVLIRCLVTQLTDLQAVFISPGDTVCSRTDHWHRQPPNLPWCQAAPPLPCQWNYSLFNSECKLDHCWHRNDIGRGSAQGWRPRRRKHPTYRVVLGAMLWSLSTVERSTFVMPTSVEILTLS